jgi:hypothetical protein
MSEHQDVLPEGKHAYNCASTTGTLPYGTANFISQSGEPRAGGRGMWGDEEEAVLSCHWGSSPRPAITTQSVQPQRNGCRLRSTYGKLSTPLSQLRTDELNGSRQKD